MAVGNEAREQVDQEIVRTAMARVLDLADVLELIEDRLDERPLAEEEAIGEGQQEVAHVLAQFGDEAQPLLQEELLSERGGDVALVAEEAPKEPVDQHRNRTAVIGVARGEAESEQLATVIDDQVEFEAVEPADGGLAAPRVDPKDAMLLDARWMAHGEGCRVNEADAGAAPALGLEIDRQGHEIARHEFYKPGIAHQARKLLAQCQLHVLGVEAFEGAVPGLLEENQDGEDLGRIQACRSSTASLPRRQELALPPWLKPLPKGVHGAVQIEYTHEQYLQFGLMGPRKPHHNPTGAISLIPN